MQMVLSKNIGFQKKNHKIVFIKIQFIFRKNGIKIKKTKLQIKILKRLLYRYRLNMIYYYFDKKTNIT